MTDFDEPDGTTFNKIEVTEPEISEIETTLADREDRYGSFVKNAYICQSLKRVVRDHAKWQTMPDFQKEAIEMMFYKIARVIEGDKEYPDNWHDIAGYALLVEKVLRKRQEVGKL